MSDVSGNMGKEVAVGSGGVSQMGLVGCSHNIPKLSGCWLTSQEAGNLFLILSVHIHWDVSPGSLYGKVLLVY